MSNGHSLTKIRGKIGDCLRNLAANNPRGWAEIWQEWIRLSSRGRIEFLNPNPRFLILEKYEETAFGVTTCICRLWPKGQRVLRGHRHVICNQTEVPIRIKFKRKNNAGQKVPTAVFKGFAEDAWLRVNPQKPEVVLVGGTRRTGNQTTRAARPIWVVIEEKTRSGWSSCSGPGNGADLVIDDP